jgi:hypothetical protein
MSLNLATFLGKQFLAIEVLSFTIHIRNFLNQEFIIMFYRTKLAHAVSIALTGTLISVASISSASAESLVSYNAFNYDRAAPNDLVSGGIGTDGWMRTAGNSCGAAGSSCGIGPSGFSGPGNNILATPLTGNAAVPWVGEDPRNSNLVGSGGFNYLGMQTLNWTAEIGLGESATVSKLDSNARYGNTILSDGIVFNYADIDSVQGAWHDGSGTGWKHDTDIGLFRSSVTQEVTLSIASLLANGDINETPDYGFTVFKGMDTKQPVSGSSSYSHHGGWHAIDNASALAVGDNVNPITPSNPFGTSGLTAINRVLDDVSGNSATFTAEAGQIYTIYLGGFMGGNWTDTRNDYQLTISTSTVPVPGAIWLFGSALAGFMGVKRRKQLSA